MLLTGRSLRTIKYLTTRSLPKPTRIHYGIPARIFQTSKLKQQSTSEDEFVFEEGSDFDTGTAPLFVPTDRNLANEKPAVLLDFLNHKTGGTGAADDSSIIPDGDAISAYLTLRDSLLALPKLRAEAYSRISRQAGSESLQQVMGMLADDVLAYFPRKSDPGGFSQAIIAILSHATSQCPLSNQRILQLYEALVISHEAVPPPLDSEIVRRIATAALMRPEAAIPPLDTLGPTLLSSDPRTEDDLSKSTQLAYELLMKVMSEGEEAYPRVLHLFEEMIKADRIPKVAQARAGEQGGSFRTVVTSAIVRACMWHRWYGTAANTLMEIFQNPQWVNANPMTEKDVQILSSLAIEVLRTLIPSTDDDDDIQKARTLIMALVPITSNDPLSSQRPPFDIPKDIIISFYESCFSCKLVEPAAHVYRHLQSPQISQYHEYPPPRYDALLWLLQHFASPGVSSNHEQRRNLEGHLYLARAMLKDIVRRNHPVSPMDRPRLVALAAASGFGLLARQLWEMYTTAGNPDRDIVRGNGHMLVRMVSLFVMAQERWDGEEERKKAKGKRPQRPHAPAASSGTNHADSDYRPRDYRQFAENVVASYIETKLPLAKASHTDLSALARAQFLLGHLPEGIHTLSVIIDRGDSPEVLDINVALAGLAYYSPTRAAEMIQYMLGRGVQPSAATFSTVLHEALKDKDTKLVEKLITRANMLGYGSLTQKGLASLLRHTMSFEYTSNKEERLQQQWSVQWAMATVKTIMHNRSPDVHKLNYHLQDHAISVSVGLECVRGSLKAMQPQMAFEFWRLLVLDRVLWDDREHKDLRAWIARSIRHQWRERYLGTDKAMEFLRELQAPGVDADGPRIGESCPRRRPVDISLEGDPGAKIM